MVLLALLFVILATTPILASGDQSKFPNVYIMITTKSGECDKLTTNFQLVCIKCRSMPEKPMCAHHALFAIPGLKDTDIVVFSDNDVLFSDWSAERVVETYTRKYNGKVVINTEAWDYPPLNGWYPPEDLKNLKVPQYVNSGFTITTAKLMKEVLSMIEEAEKDWLASIGRKERSGHLKMEEDWGLDDQGVLNMFSFASYNKPFVLDLDRDFVWAVQDSIHYFIPANRKCRSSFYDYPDYCHGSMAQAELKSRIRPVIVNNEVKKMKQCRVLNFKGPCDDLFDINNCTITRRDINLSDGLQVWGPLQSLAFHFNGPFKNTHADLTSKMSHCLNQKETIYDNSYEMTIPKVSFMFDLANI